MTREDFIDLVTVHMKEQYPEAKISHTEAKIWVKSIFDVLSEAIITDSRIVITGFGAFTRKVIKEKRHGNVHTGEVTTDPEHERICFSPSDVLVEKLKKN